MGKNFLGFVLLVVLSVSSNYEIFGVCAVPQFTTLPNLTVDRPKALAIADFNGDRIADLAILRDSLNPNGGVVQVWTGSASGQFNWTGSNDLAVTTNVVDIVAGEFDQDGNADVAVIGGPNPNYTVGVLFGNGNGGFSGSASFTVGGDPRDIAAADFNGDGRTDIVVADFAGRTASILPNNGGRNFGTPFGVPTGGPAPNSLVTGKFDTNSTQDLVTVNNDRTLSVRLGNGNFTFNSVNLPATLIGTQQDLASGDFNKDGILDLAAASFSDVAGIRLGAGNGQFTAPTGDPFPVANVVNHLAVADFNGDRLADLAAAADGTSGTNSLAILINSGDGVFGSPFLFSPDAGISPKVYRIDFDKNRSPDLLVIKEVGGNKIVRLRNDCAFPSPAPADFDNDGKSDLSIFRPSNGQWWLDRSAQGVIAHTFGTSTDLASPADFTGDGKTDVAVFRPNTGEWFVLRSENNTYYSFPFGSSSDRPVAGDYDGDGVADAAVFRPSNSTWFVQGSTAGTSSVVFGSAGDSPVPADYDGDGEMDIAIFRPSLGQWWIRRSALGVIAVTFGISTDSPAVGDFTGDGRADIGFWRSTTGEWFVLRSEDFTFYSFPFGASGDQPVPADYDGDGRTDPAVFRNGTWFVNRSTAGLLIQQFGTTGDLPLPGLTR